MKSMEKVCHGQVRAAQSSRADVDAERGEGQGNHDNSAGKLAMGPAGAGFFKTGGGPGEPAQI